MGPDSIRVMPIPRKRTKRCTRAGGGVGFEVNIKRVRRVNVVDMRLT